MQSTINQRKTQQFAIFLQKTGTKYHPGMWPFRLPKASVKHLSKVGCGKFSSVRGSGKAFFQHPSSDQMSTGRRAVGRANGTKNAVLILISAHVGKTAKRQNPRRLMSKVNARFLFSRRKVDLWEGWGIFCGRGETWLLLGYLICWFLCTNFGTNCARGAVRLLVLSNGPSPRGGPMVVVCVLLLHTHNNSSVTLWFVNIIVVLFPLSYLVCDIRLINNSRRR